LHMPQERRLGRGLSDVSNLFLSEDEGEGRESREQVGESDVGHAGGADDVRVLGVACAAEGIQKSFLTINLALELAKLDRRVVIIDADPSAPSVGFLMGVPAGRVFDRLEHSDGSVGGRCLEGPLGVRVVLMGDDPTRIATLASEGLIREARGVAEDVAVVIINAPPVHRGAACGSWRLCTHLLVLTPPEIPGMMDAYLLLKAAALSRHDLAIGTVVTGAGTAVEGRAIYEKMASVAKRHLGLSLINYGFVFDDVRVYESVWRQEPVALSYTESTSARCIKEIAEALVGASSETAGPSWEDEDTDAGAMETQQ